MSRALALVIAAAVLSAAPVASFASCGSASCPIDVQTADHTGRGDVRLDYIHEYIDQTRVRIGRHSASVGEIRGHHDEVSTLNIIQRIAVEAGLTDRLSLQLTLPMVHREHRHIHHHMGSDLEESWNFEGVGDLEVLSRFAVINRPDGARASLIVGAVLPTGRDSAVNADGDEAEVGILPGKEAYGVIAGASLSKSFAARTANGMHSEMPVFVSSTYQWNGEGKEDYRIGNVWLANAGLTYPVLPRVGLILQTNLKVARKDTPGLTREETGKTGGTFIYASPGLRLTLAQGLWTYFQVQLPVYQRVNSIQLVSAANLIGGISYRFNVLR